ncbi:hypothetical protein DCAR_0103447 [Daucus carota subsp. sativus]|uniref:Uncharacterized protein n=1 Tax=Daucus carota subsp. sativus TaxID=79200 RepID=A0A166HZT8_DAUCS|nr:PREDICTED: nucleolar MIF4G domain-containing protein 1 isoform X2 [Daucus carota subsp. sativus]XP_017228149.1 PREDICTED: nucleolar MIF4G domain-containing protein 1 isoform X2 [Daucus carota subsp. sativus]WOG84264.1 hypothetical protein DCAR_0103447 [Daucus carota subsp. sativus]
MDVKIADKSRRARRKEARLEKNKKKFSSWVDHQQSRKLSKKYKNEKSKTVKFLEDDICVLRGMGMVPKDCENEVVSGFEEPSEVGSFVDSVQAPVVLDGNVSKTVKRKKGSVKKSKFEEFMEMDRQGNNASAEEDLRLERKLAKKLKIKDGKLSGKDASIDMLLDGISSVSNGGGKGENDEASGKSLLKASSRNRSRKSRLVDEEREKLETEKAGHSGDEVPESLDPGTVKNHDMKNTNIPSLDKMELDSLVGLKSMSKVRKAKKTKFEEYLQMDVKKDFVSAEEDMEVEKKLSKKLKVKNGKLRGDDDDMNMLFEGLPSTLFSSAHEEIPDAEEDPQKTLEDCSTRGKRKKKGTKQDSQMAPDTMVAQSEAVVRNVKYVAPHLRSQGRIDSNDHPQIRRRVRGLLNRLSESNVEAITGEAFSIFRDVGRSIGSEIISAEVLAACSGGPRGNEQYAAVHAAFVAGMSCMVGIDFGAKLLSLLARAFEDEYTKEDNLSLRNLILLFSYIYIFGVCSSELMYDFIAMLSKRLTEVDVSIILTVLQSCGMKLRSDDPAAMKDFIVSVQNRVNELKSNSEINDASKGGRRMEFMLETICDIKNNKQKPKEENVQQTKMKKWLLKLKVDEILIRGIKWNTLLDPDKKGQWWLSGEMSSDRDNIEEIASKTDLEITETQKMLQLAAAQRMNTDARRAIFCIIMSGEDYIDTFEKLLRLDLQGKQDREIMRIIVDCCLQEKVFNKYYCVLASKLCSHDKNHKFTLQYCLWDHFKEMESMELNRSMHLAKFISEMLASYSISLAVLKVVDFHDVHQLTPKRIMHFRMLFEAIFAFPESLVWNMFTRIAVTPEYEPLRSGIKFFIRKYVASSQKSLADKIKVAKKALNNAEGTIL